MATVTRTHNWTAADGADRPESQSGDRVLRTDVALRDGCFVPQPPAGDLARSTVSPGPTTVFAS